MFYYWPSILKQKQRTPKSTLFTMQGFRPRQFVMSYSLKAGTKKLGGPGRKAALDEMK